MSSEFDLLKKFTLVKMVSTHFLRHWLYLTDTQTLATS